MQVKLCSFRHLPAQTEVCQTKQPSRNTALPHSFWRSQSYRNRFENYSGDGMRSTSKEQGPPLWTCRTRGTEQLKDFAGHMSWQRRGTSTAEPVTLVPYSAETCFKGNPRAPAPARQLPACCLAQGTPHALPRTAGQRKFCCLLPTLPAPTFGHILVPASPSGVQAPP